VDRLTAIVALRWRTDVRALVWARERTLGVALTLLGLLLFSTLASFAAYFGVRLLEARSPEILLPAASAAATLMGTLWLVSPLVAGVSFAESHDVSRLAQFPIPLRTLAASSLIANLTQPRVLARLPLPFAVALALTRRPAAFPFVLAGAGASFMFVLAASQLVALLLHRIARNRRLHDLSLFVGLALGFAISLVPLLLMGGDGQAIPALARIVLGSDAFAVSPFGWGLRAAVHAGRGEVAPFLAWMAAALAAVVAVVAATTLLIGAVQRGELDLGAAAGTAAPRPRMWFAGAIGSLLEKDLRSAWRDPGLKATLLMGIVGPLLFLFFMSRARPGAGSGGMLLTLAAFVGASSFGANVFGLERRGIGLLLSFPAERWRILVAKNLAAAGLRLPGMLTMLAAGVFLVPLAFLPAALTIAVVTWLSACGLDNYMSILFPVAAPAPGQSPQSGSASGARGLGFGLMGAALLAAALALAAPFVFLASLPLLLERPGLWLGTLPLAAAGSVAVYSMLVCGAERLLLKREPELLERILGEA
jgi:ABC-2 type transport system permease protein